jgi:hypothetical protein
MRRGARRQQDHPKPEAKSSDSPAISGEEQVAPRGGQRNPSSSAAKRMNQQAPGVVRPNSARKCTTKTSQVPKPAPNDAPHNMPLRQLLGRGRQACPRVRQSPIGCLPLSATQGRHDQAGMAASPSTPRAADAPTRTFGGLDDIFQLERARLRGRRSARSYDRTIMVWKTQALCARVRPK